MRAFSLLNREKRCRRHSSVYTLFGVHIALGRHLSRDYSHIYIYIAKKWTKFYLLSNLFSNNIAMAQ